MINQDSVNTMIYILEGQIADLKSDLEKVDTWVTKSIIKQAIKEQEVLLKNAMSKRI